jgi:prephenate dehydrogenase
MTDLQDMNITVIGLGLMGGSLAGALRQNCRSMTGVDNDTESNELALSRGIVERATNSLSDGVKGSQLVILATPVRTILRLLDEIGPLLPDECVVMDLGSTKAHVVKKMDTLPRHVQPLGGHPMCGKETAGIVSADPLLYRNCVFALTPLARTSSNTLDLGISLVKTLGARPLVLDPDRHDRVVALTSHLPYLLACSLVGSARRGAVVEGEIWELVSGGFRDTSRLAASHVEMMLDILLTNRDAILQSLATCRLQLDNLAGLIEREDEEGLRKILTQYQACRSGLA